MAVPMLERAPGGLREPWLGIWRVSLKRMKTQGTWTGAQRPLLDEYVYALKAACEAREGFDWLSALEVYADAERDDLPDIAWSVLGQIATGLPSMWDKHAKRASALADQLILTPRAKKMAGVKIGDAPVGVDPFAAVDAGVSSLAAARARRDTQEGER